jgi:hypothetical protein
MEVMYLFFDGQEILTKITQEILTKNGLFSQETLTKTLFSSKNRCYSWAGVCSREMRFSEMDKKQHGANSLSMAFAVSLWYCILCELNQTLNFHSRTFGLMLTVQVGV